MFSSIVLDALLVVILLMMIPLGFLRGGLREVCTSAGVLFGMLLANEWAESWGSRIASRLDIDLGAAQFLTGVVIVVLTGGVIGYGGSAAFSYRPGPGGRMYGACIALFNGIVFAGYLINLVIDRVYDGKTPDLIANGMVARALSSGFGWVLLICAVGVLAATVFGMFVRERPDDDLSYAYAPQPEAPRHAPSQAPAVRPDTAETAAHSPVRIREVRHWEEPEPAPQPSQGYGSGWRQTWPDPKGQGPMPPWEQRPAPRNPSPKRIAGSTRKSQETSSSSQEVLRDWIEEEGSGEPE